MTLLDINGREIDIGKRIAWVHLANLPEHRTIKTGICHKIVLRMDRRPSIGIIDEAFYDGVTCYNTERLGVLTGDINEDSLTLEKLSKLDDRPQV